MAGAWGHSALTSETPRTLQAGHVAKEVLLSSSLGLSSSLPALFPLKSQGREERDVRAGEVAASTKLRGHFAKGDAKQPGKHARGHLKGTRHKKKAGGIGGTVTSPDETRIPDGYHSQIAYIVKERSGGGAGRGTIQQQRKCNLGFRDSV